MTNLETTEKHWREVYTKKFNKCLNNCVKKIKERLGDYRFQLFSVQNQYYWRLTGGSTY